MKINIKYKKNIKKIKKKITQIIFKKYNFIIGKNNILNINYIKLTKNFSYIYVYVDFINQKNINTTNNIIKYLQKLEKKIKKELIKKTNIRYISKIIFKHDKFNIKKYKLLKKIKIANKKFK